MKLRYLLPLVGFVVPTVGIGYGIVIPRSCIAGVNDLTIGFAASIVHPGGNKNNSVVAFHRETGKLLWGVGNDPVGYGSPIVAVIAGKRQVIAPTGQSVLGIDPSRFSVVHHGHERSRDVPATAGATIRAQYQLNDARVVLCVAAKRPHKNQELLIRAAPMLDPDTAIVLAGHAEPYEDELRALAQELGMTARVRFVGYVSDSDLEGLWSE